MVENNEQWDDIGYSEGQNNNEYQSDYEDNEYTEQETSQDYDEGAYDESSYEGEDNYDEDAYDEDDEYDEDEHVVKRKNPLIFIIFGVLIVVILLILLLRAGASKQNTENNSPSEQNSVVTNNMDNSLQSQESGQKDLDNSFFEGSNNEMNNSDNNMMSVNFNESGETNVTTGEGENQQVATVTESNPENVAKESDLFDTQSQAVKTKEQENNAIMVVYNKPARLNPFKPTVDTSKSEKNPEFDVLNNVPFEIIEPPKTSIVDENLNRLLKTQISGILYDSVSPSAIVNLNGLDYFVKVGDTISGYTIKSITRDKVQISYKNNSYVASVGELFTPGNLEKQQAVANLQNKFAGRYKN